MFFPTKAVPTVPDQDRLAELQALLPVITKALRRKGIERDEMKPYIEAATKMAQVM